MFFRQLEVGTNAVFAYLIGDPEAGDAIVIDPADDVDYIISLADKNKMTISRIINTHGHVDHVMGNAQMKEKTGADILIHHDEAGYLTKIGDYWLNMFNARKSPPADGKLNDGDKIFVGRYEWEVLHTPGHTPGGICLYSRSFGLCLTGDTLFVESVGRTDGPRSSYRQMINAIREKLMVLPDDTEIFPGHNYGITPTSTIGHERLMNPFINGTYSEDMM